MMHPDHKAAEVGQQPANLAGLAQFDMAMTEGFANRLGHDEAAATAQGGSRLSLRIAPGAQPSPVEGVASARHSGGRAGPRGGERAEAEPAALTEWRPVSVVEY